MAGMSTILRTQRGRSGRGVALATFACALAFAGCGEGDDDVPGSGGKAGKGGQAGQAGTGAGRAGGAGVGEEGGEAGAPSTGGAGGRGGGSGGAGGEGGGGGSAEGGSAGDGATAGVSGQSVTGGGPNAGAGGSSGSSGAGEAGASAGEGGGQQGGVGGVGGSAGGTAGTAGGGSGGTGGGGSNPCGGPSACTCLKVAPSGDDAAAASSNGATPFESVRAALDFAQANPEAPRDVCVASGPACGASATFDFDGDLELRDGIGVYGRYEATSFTRCDASITTLSGNDSSSTILASELVTGPTRLDGFTVDVPIEVDRSNGVTLANLVATTVTFDRALASSIEDSTIIASGVTALSVTRSDVDVLGNFVESDVMIDPVVPVAYVQLNTEGRITGNDFSSTAGAWALFVERRVAELSGNTIRSTGSGLWLDGAGIDAVGNDISGTLALQITGDSRVSASTITAGRGSDVLAVYGDSFTLENNDIRSASSDPVGDSRGVLCLSGCKLLGNRIDISGNAQNGIRFEDAACVADGNFVSTTQLSSADSAFYGFAGTLRNNVMYGVLRLDGPVLVQHNTVQGQLWFHNTDAVVEGNIVRSLGTPLVKASNLASVSVPWARLTKNDILPGSSGRFFQTVNSFGQTVNITTVNDLNLLTDPVRTTVTNGNFSADPLYSTFPHLGLGSPCIDAGDASAPGDVDFDGEARTGAKDVGADEYGAALACAGATCSSPGGLYCVDVGRQSQCICATGYTNPPGDPLECEVDECATDNGGCDELTDCTNTFPGRTCSACPAGYSGTGATGCDDIDECQNANGGCDPLVSCQNVPGGRTCGACPAGHSGTGETGCTEVNECLTNNGGCDPLTQCTNTVGSRLCGACPSGYSGDGYVGCTLSGFRAARLSAGGAQSCAIDVNGSLLCWGFGQYFWGASPAPAGTFLDVAASAQNTCAIHGDGSIGCWGENNFNQGDPPTGSFTSIASGDSGTTCAIRTDETIACWGANFTGTLDVPAGTFQAVSVEALHVCAIRTDGTVACWGDDTAGIATPPSGTFLALGLGHQQSCGLRTDGTLTCWGSPSASLANPPSGTFVGLATFAASGCALRADGTLACWGNNSGGQLDAPNGSFKSVALGGAHACGIRLDDSVTCWGANTNGQRVPPACAPGYVLDGGQCVPA
jgi:hypothetical protein